MTHKEFAQLGKGLLPGLPGFAVKGPLVFRSPVGHTLQALDFDRSADARHFYLHVFFLPLCVPRKHVSFGFGKRIRGTGWNVDIPDLEAALASAVQTEAVPFLSGLDTPKDVAETMKRLKGESSKDLYVHEAIAYMLALAGESAAAVGWLDRLLSLPTAELGPWVRDIETRARLIRAKLVENPAKALDQLALWEMESVRNLGLEKFR